MKSRWIIGRSEYLDLAFHAWKQARQDETVIRIEVPQDSEHEFDLGVLDGLNPTDGAMFVAFDERFGNFKRRTDAGSDGTRLQAGVLHPLQRSYRH